MGLRMCHPSEGPDEVTRFLGGCADSSSGSPAASSEHNIVSPIMKNMILDIFKGTTSFLRMKWVNEILKLCTLLFQLKCGFEAGIRESIYLVMVRIRRG
jgi:hypothetical protein